MDLEQNLVDYLLAWYPLSIPMPNLANAFQWAYPLLSGLGNYFLALSNFFKCELIKFFSKYNGFSFMST